MAIPGIPTSFWTQQGDGQVYLSWDIIAGATSYQVQRSSDGVTFVLLASPTDNFYLDTSVTINTKYYYQIASTNSSGTSSYTTAQSVVATLPGQISLGELRLRAQQAADRENSQFLTLPEWNYNINQSAKELYDILITVYEDYYVASRLSITTDGTSSQYDLPNGQNYSGASALYKLYGVDCGLDSSENAWVTLKKYNFIDRNRFVYPQAAGLILGFANMQYRLVGSTIKFMPIPSGSQTIGLWYFPRRPWMLRDTDVLDGVNGWEEYVILDAACKALRKEESATSELMAAKIAMKKRIEESAVNRDAGQPETISDVRRMNNSGYGNGFQDFGGDF